MGSVLTGFFWRFLTALGTDPVDHQFHFNHGIVGWQSRRRYTTFGQAKYLAASDTMEMRVLGGRFITVGAKAPDPVVCRDSVGESGLYQPFQIAVETDAIHPPRFRGFQALLELGVTEGLLGFQKRLEHHHP